MPFAPVAIVGEGCVLPGALSPEEFWNLLQRHQSAIQAASAGSWALDHQRILASGSGLPEKSVTDRGGYIVGFESRQHLDPSHQGSPSHDHLEPSALWLLECCRQSLTTCSRQGIDPERQSMILGNLGYPTIRQSQRAEKLWLHPQAITADLPSTEVAQPCGLEAELLAESVAKLIGIGGCAYTIDAACASSIYAIDLACKALQDGRADLVFAGGSNDSDDLFLHVGFTTLHALSVSGASSPFGQNADGLIPSHGAALVALKRLDDAIEAGDRILGVIRGIGLSNDGRSGGFLSPSQDGQIKAIRQALESASLNPSDIQYIECHATGTPIGDGIELAALREVFGANSSLRFGSHKGNIGHLITAAGAAGLIKLLAMFKHKTWVSSFPATDLRPEAKLAPLEICDRIEAWPGDRPRRAGLSAFGFGGANAHMIVEEWIPGSPSEREFGHTHSPAQTRKSSPTKPQEDIVIVSACALTGASGGWDEFINAVSSPVPASPASMIRSLDLDVQSLGFPPRDLQKSLPQQVAMLSAVEKVMAGQQVSETRTAVYVGTAIEHEISRYGARWRLPERIGLAGKPLSAQDSERLSNCQAAIIAPLEAASVTGTMPNIAAHRINVKFNFQRSGFTVSAGESSGIRALQIAVDDLKSNECDAAIVGAIDLCAESIHSLSAVPPVPGNSELGDACVAFLLKRRSDAEQACDSILGVIRVVEQPATASVTNQQRSTQAVTRFGRCGAAMNLLEVAFHLAELQTSEPSTQELSEQSQSDRRDLSRRVMTFSSAGFLDLQVSMQWVGKNLTSPRRPNSDRLLQFPAHLPPIALRIQSAPPPNRGSVEMPPETRQEGLNIPELHEQYLRTLASSHAAFLAGRAHMVRQLLTRRLSGHHPPADRPVPVKSGTQPGRRLSPSSLPSPGPLAPTRSAAVSTDGLPIPDSQAAIGADVDKSESEKVRKPIGPAFNREQLEILAGGRISEVFGPLFQQQDEFRRQVRLPMPPLLLVDRVTGIDAEPGRMETGTIWTETDVKWDSWYLHQGVMPAGIMIESGQADLLLISWMGADFLNRDQRVYRLLGCEATFFGGLPRPGDTLRYQITVDGHARQGDIRLFFFHYDCYINGILRLRVRHGQAGFFTDAELRATEGILWDPQDRVLSSNGFEGPPVDCHQSRFSKEQLGAFYAGNIRQCLGAGFEWTETHTRTPRIAGPELRLIDEISSFDSGGGPWQRGYLRAERAIHADDWFFAGHFLNDPCMPGTLMLEACLQAMSFYLTALGLTVSRDGWQFEPASDCSVLMQCRGQVTPQSRLLTTEILVEEVVADPEPTLYADVLCTVDGVKAFYAKRIGLRLAPGWPITSAPIPESIRPGVNKAALRGDYAAFLECAWGKPSASFGPAYQPFDRYRRTPRLPSPPYHFISRAIRIDTTPDDVRPNAEVEVEYDVPPDAWYFDQSPQPAMPLAVLMEVALQPCGWLAMMSGVVLKARQELFFRNLDGKSTVYAHITPDSGTIRTRVRLIRSSSVGETTIMAFVMECFVRDQSIARFETSFGFFTKASLSQQVGVPVSNDERAVIANCRESLQSTSGRPGELFGACVPMLKMTDRILIHESHGGRFGRGRILGEQNVAPSAWYFKAHFYQDPVQPGSLGVQALANLLGHWMRTKYSERFQNPIFEPLASDEEIVWSYRGQVLPSAGQAHQWVEIAEVNDDNSSITAIAEGTLWVDGLCIYRLPRFAMRMSEARPCLQAKSSQEVTTIRVIDPEQEPWWKDHCPTYSAPVMPLMGIANEMAVFAQSIVPCDRVVGLEDLRVLKWLALPSPKRLKLTGHVIESQAGTRDKDVRVALQLFESETQMTPIATAIVHLQSEYQPAPARLLPSADALTEQADPYLDGSLFHGPAFQLVRRLWSGNKQSLVEISIDGCQVPSSLLHPALLDASLHAVPHADWRRWVPSAEKTGVGYPIRLERMQIFGPPPASGIILAEARLVSYESISQTASIQIDIVQNGSLWASFDFQEKFFPMGSFAESSVAELRSFIRDRQFKPGVSLSRRSGSTTRLTAADVRAVSWLPGTLEHIYQISGGTEDLATNIAVREHMASEWLVHPSLLDWDDVASMVRHKDRPTQCQRVHVTRDGMTIVVRNV